MLNSNTLGQADPQDRADLVVSVVSSVKLAEGVKSDLLALLNGGIPASCFAKCFNRKAVADKELAMCLLEAEQAALRSPGVARARAAGPRHLDEDHRRKLPMPTALKRHEFAWQVIVRHKDALSHSCFERLLRHVQIRDMSTDDASMLVATCLSYNQEDYACRGCVRVANLDASLAIQLMSRHASLPLTLLQDVISEDAKARIFQGVVKVWGPHATALLLRIQRDDRRIRQLICWTEDQKVLAIATCRCLHEVLDLVLGLADAPEVTVQIGKQLMRTFVACGTLHPSAAEKLPLPWLQDLKRMANSAHIVVQALLAHMESCPDEDLLEQMPKFWDCSVWAEEPGSSCERVISLLNRWCSQAGQGQEATLFALKALQGLPVKRLKSLDILYSSPALPAQVFQLVLGSYTMSRVDCVEQSVQEALNKIDVLQQDVQEAHMQITAVHDDTLKAFKVAQTAQQDANKALHALEAAQGEATRALQEVHQLVRRVSETQTR